MSLDSRVSRDQTYLVEFESLLELLETLLDASGVVCSSDESFGSFLSLEGFEDVGDNYQLPNHPINMSIEFLEDNAEVVTPQEQPAVFSRYHQSSSRSTYPVSVSFAYISSPRRFGSLSLTT
jgi:hypothetical protein